MEEVNLTFKTHFIYKVSNCKIKDMDVRFDNLRDFSMQDLIYLLMDNLY